MSVLIREIQLVERGLALARFTRTISNTMSSSKRRAKNQNGRIMSGGSVGTTSVVGWIVRQMFTDP